MGEVPGALFFRRRPNAPKLLVARPKNRAPGAQDLAGGVIHSTEQVPAWGLLPEPRVFDGIDQDQCSPSGLAPPATTVLGSTTPPHGRDAGRLPPTSHGFATDVELLEFAQLLGQMARDTFA